MTISKTPKVNNYSTDLEDDLVKSLYLENQINILINM